MGPPENGVKMKTVSRNPKTQIPVTYRTKVFIFGGRKSPDGAAEFSTCRVRKMTESSTVTIKPSRPPAVALTRFKKRRVQNFKYSFENR